MKKALPLIAFFVFMVTISCSRPKYYTSSTFEQRTAHHRIVAILPAEMIFTGKQPENLSPDDIKQIEETESKSFQQSLYNSILRYANGRKYFTQINFQDAVTTQKLLEENKIDTRDSWKRNANELAKILGVDAVVRMRIEKKRYMSDLASYGISVGRSIINNTGIGSKIPIPIRNRTNDIYASCNVVSDNATLWNDSYKGASNWNNPSDQIIEDITDAFGRNFPYKIRK